MMSENKGNPVRKIFDRIRASNQDDYSAKADNTARLDYQKGNIDQTKLKNTEVWDSCPVLDEAGKPMKATEEQ